MPYGRGGAGNIEEAYRQSSTIKKDVEANRQTADDTVIPSQSSKDQYAYTGRGGAGNYYSPSGLTQSGTFASSTAKHASTTLGNSVPSGQDATSSTPAAKAAAPFAGRGGAGNYSYSDERKQLEAEVVGTSVETLEGIEMRAISDNVTKDVDEALPRPQPAHVAPPDIWQGSNYGV